MKILEMNNIKKSSRGLEVLKGISLSVEEREVVSIIGPSGSGKSTLLRCATLLETIDGGELIYMNERIASSDNNGGCVYKPKNELKEFHKYFGLVFQNFNLFPHYSVLKNITDALVSVYHTPKPKAEERAEELLSQLGLADKRNCYPYQLSGGQQQRLCIARALAPNPKLLFFDEPTSALDPQLTGEVLKAIKELAAPEPSSGRHKTTMVIVTHEMQLAREVSDRIIFMEDGRVRLTGTPGEFFSFNDERIRDFISIITAI